jgi:hypothetical protein
MTWWWRRGREWYLSLDGLIEEKREIMGLELGWPDSGEEGGNETRAWIVEKSKGIMQYMDMDALKVEKR